MKKKNIIIISLLIILCVVGLVLFYVNYNLKKETNKKEDNFVNVYYETNDRIVYTYFNDSEKKSIKLNNKELSDYDDVFKALEELLEDLEKVEIYKDGGSILYRGTDMSVLMCNTLDGNKDVYIGSKLMNYEAKFCKNHNQDVPSEKLESDKLEDKTDNNIQDSNKEKDDTNTQNINENNQSSENVSNTNNNQLNNNQNISSDGGSSNSTNANTNVNVTNPPQPSEPIYTIDNDVPLNPYEIKHTKTLQECLELGKTVIGRYPDDCPNGACRTECEIVIGKYTKETIGYMLTIYKMDGVGSELEFEIQ